MPDYTGKDAGDRVLHVNLIFFKYGTNDKVHAAALVLSMVLLFAMMGLIFFGTKQGTPEWDDKAFSWLGGAFLFISGLALGKGATGQNHSDHHDD